MKKLLIVTYYFPPSGGPGVQRVLKFAKYLPEFGWEPIVLTVKDADYPARDESLLKEIPPAVRVYRTKILNRMTSTEDSPKRSRVHRLMWMSYHEKEQGEPLRSGSLSLSVQPSSFRTRASDGMVMP